MAESVDAPDLKSVEKYLVGVQVPPLLSKYSWVCHSPMKYRIDTKYCWYRGKKQIVLMYFIQNVPFTFDDLPDFALHDAEVVEMANIGKSYEEEDLYRSAMYLMMEECNPLLHELELENPELLPVD